MEAKYKTLLKGLEEIERGITQDHKALQGWLAQIRECFHGKLIEFYAFLAENISAWVDECDSAEVFDCPWTSEKQVKRIAKELADYAKQKAEAAAIAWSEEELAPSIKEACEAFQQEVNACLRNLHERISDAKGQFFDSRDGDEQAMDLDFLEAYGFKSDILGDTVRIGTSYLGALGLSALGFLIAGPLGWIGFVAGFVGLFLREGFAAEEKMKKLKQEVGQKLVNAIREKQAETIKEAVETFPIFGTLERSVDQFKKAAGKYVADLKDQAEKAKRLCGESERKRDQREKSLKDTLRKAEALSAEVQGLLLEVNA